ncbi:MAG: type II toxin-antitoxin system HicB family antitoxin [Nitrospinae bacterium]|nr:type II toxin-antitoxin system HicB family antitoxin [Nitrospinota bacterium]
MKSVIRKGSKLSKELSYRVIFKPEPEGGFTVTVPALPGCVTYGATLEEAGAMARDAVEAYLHSLKKHGEPIADDSATLESQLIVHHV